MTALPNRACFRERLEHAIGQCDPERNSLAVMYIDLDGFKRNDGRGPAAPCRHPMYRAKRGHCVHAFSDPKVVHSGKYLFFL